MADTTFNIGVTSAQVHHSLVPRTLLVLRLRQRRGECHPHVFRSRALAQSSEHFFWSTLSRVEENGQVDEPLQYGLVPRQVGRDTVIKESWFPIRHSTITTYCRGVWNSAYCISSPRLLSVSSGRGSAAARMLLVQKTRFPRKPLM